MKKKYGLKLRPVSSKAYKFLGGQVPVEVLQPDMDWTPFLPEKEFQNLNMIEPYACVPFTILNCAETLIKRKYGLDRNYSDRFLATVIDTRKGGCDPEDACEFLRKIGVPLQEEWPFDESINTTEKFFAKLPPKLYEIAQEFNKEWIFMYDVVPSVPSEISTALTCSPLLGSVYGWKRRPDGLYYRPKGYRDNHATTMFYLKEGEFRRYFDTYENPHIKDVEWGTVPMRVVRFWITKRITQEVRPKFSFKSLFQKLCSIF